MKKLTKFESSALSKCRGLIVALLLLVGMVLSACELVPPLTPTPIPPTAVPSPTPTPIPAEDTPAGFANFLAAANDARLSDRSYMVSEYMARVTQSPLVDDTTAIFIWRGEGRDIQLIGDMTYWDSEKAIALERIADTDFWWYSAEFPPTSRLDYKFVVSGSERLDPLNPYTVGSEAGLRSELRMPAYVTPYDLIQDTTEFTRGELSEHTIQSAYLGQTRSIFVYEPAGQLVGAKLPSLYVHDGANALTLVDMPGYLDQIIGRREIPPLVTVFITPFDREIEYNRNDDYANFVALEVVPYVQQTFNTDPAPNKTGTLGSSLGGLISLHIGMAHPDVFGLVASQSGALTYGNSTILDAYGDASAQPLRLHLTVGTFEDALISLADDGNVLAANRELNAILGAKGYDYSYTEYPQGHSWAFWRSTWGDALRFLYK